MLGVALLAIKGFEGFQKNPDATSRLIAVPGIEEVLKLVPILLFLWFVRGNRIWTVGPTDLFVLGAAAGVGFGLVEDAYIRDRFGWGDSVNWLPLAEITAGRVIAGHAVWTSLAAVTVGFGLLLRNRGMVAIVVGASGVVWTIFDHAANNYQSVHRGGTADAVHTLTAHGWISIWAVVATGIAAVGIDLWIQGRTLPPLEELRQPPGLTLGTWAYRLARRALATAAFQHYGSRGAGPSGAEGAITSLVEGMRAATFPMPGATAAPPLGDPVIPSPGGGK